MGAVRRANILRQSGTSLFDGQEEEQKKDQATTPPHTTKSVSMSPLRLSKRKCSCRQERWAGAS